jgi:hypothetical protein
MNVRVATKKSNLLVDRIDLDRWLDDKTSAARSATPNGCTGRRGKTPGGSSRASAGTAPSS